MRPVCDLHDCSQIKMPFGNRTPFLTQGMVDWWFGLLSYACVLHTFQRENTYAKLHENEPFEMKNYKTHPSRRLRRLDARAFYGNCHGCPQILETPLVVKLLLKFLTLITRKCIVEQVVCDCSLGIDGAGTY